MKLLSSLGESYSSFKLSNHYRKHMSGYNREMDRRGLSKLTSQEKKDAIAYWKKFNLKANTDWHRCFSWFNGNFDPRYVSGEIFYTLIERKLNDFRYLHAYSNKNHYDIFFRDLRRPKTIIKNMRGCFFDSDLEPINKDMAKKILLHHDGKMVIKPSDSYGGKGFKILYVENGDLKWKGEKIDIKKLFDSYGNDFIIQKYIKQHESFSALHPSSLNTIRIMTIRLDGKIHHLSSVMRMGRDDSEMDNVTQGGISIGVDTNGNLGRWADYNIIERYEKHPTTKVKFEGYRIHGSEKARKLALELHKRSPYFDILSWDTAIDEKGEAVMIEMNIKGQELNFHQAHNGPIFGHLTDKVIEEMKSR